MEGEKENPKQRRKMIFMTVNILVKEKNVIELELVGMDHSLAQLLAEKLNLNDDVDFASYKLEHPITAHPKLYLRTKKGDATKLLLDTIAEVKQEISDFKEQFQEIVK